jgi:Ca-activated chloride channel homolog
MKRLLFMIVPVILIMLAFRPGHSVTVSGRVTASSGTPIAGVSVQVKGGPASTTTNGKGAYVLTVPSSINTLVFSSAGYQTIEVTIAGRSVVNATLSYNTSMLSDSTAVASNGYSKKYQMMVKEKSSSADGVLTAPMIIMDEMIMDRKVDESEESFNTEGYDNIKENRFFRTTDNPLSTFSIDVDAASYSNVRRYLNQGQLPPAGAVRIEEMVNYFHYEYPQPVTDQPFSINTEITEAPWNKEHRLVLIGLQGKNIPTQYLPASNLVFLIDVSGSMDQPNKLPLVKSSMKMLVDQLRSNDKVSIVVYAGAAGMVLKPTSGEDKLAIKTAIDNLDAGGSTAGGEGIKLAYKTANDNFAKGGNNRVILCTDGDFNVGESSDDAMERLIEQERKSGVFLTVLGYGMGNYKDSKMQKLADKGNGNHAYIDGITEAKKVLVNEFGGTLFTIAKDVKLQVEFNPAKVQGYRLIGYENRMLAKEDFNDDTKDAGELGSGHTVTALYEIIPVGVKSDFLKSVDGLKYQKNMVPLSQSSQTDEILTVKFRYKQPDGDVSKLIEHPLRDGQVSLSDVSDNLRFAASVAEFGLILRNSEYKSAASFDQVLKLAKKGRGNDEEGYRSEFIRLVESAQLLAKGVKPVTMNEDLGER